jgi:membrane protease YdiL (CAAX protease family)
LFLLPLLALYEGGLLWLGERHPEALRNGADTWLHWGLETFGLSQLYWAPALVGLVFLLWSWGRRLDRPADCLGLCIGMAIESIAFALGLWSLSKHLPGFLKGFGIVLQLPATQQAAGEQQELLAQAVAFVGAGVYEEILFRLFLFGGLIWLMRCTGLASRATIFLAAMCSAVLFAAAHYAGPYGEPYDRFSFLFRTVAGLYFTLIFQMRGFGIAVGTHACYDVLVGMIIS